MIKKIAAVSAASAVAVVAYIIVADPATVAQAASLNVRRKY